MQNIEKLKYTFRHRQAFLFALMKIITMLSPEEQIELICEAMYHDLDKSLLYTLVPKDEASAYHRATSSHHMENSDKKSTCDLIKAVIDYKCAGYTKADKPRNAYDTILELEPKHKDELLETCHRFGMDSHYKNTPSDPEWLEYKRKRNLPEPTDENILMEIYDFIAAFPDKALELMDYARSLSKDD